MSTLNATLYNLEVASTSIYCLQKRAPLCLVQVLLCALYMKGCYLILLLCTFEMATILSLYEVIKVNLPIVYHSLRFRFYCVHFT